MPRNIEDCPQGHSRNIFGARRKNGSFVCRECDRIRRSRQYHKQNPDARFNRNNEAMEDLINEEIEDDITPFYSPIMDEWPLTLCREVWPI